MEGIFSKPLVLVDIETTGMNPYSGNVLEVAAIRVENGTITDEFQTLLNPGGDVPPFITKLTGITTTHIKDAPSFADISDRLLEMCDGAVFVAHNVRFDYSFLKQEFQRIGMTFSSQLLCTVRLSRALYPEQKSHKLSSLIARHDFYYSARHRAYDDALVLWQFLERVSKVFDTDTIQSALKTQFCHPSLPRQLNKLHIDSLPTTPGIYTFHDEQGAPLYIGKSINIKKRVLSHFTRDTSEYRELKISQMIHSVTFEKTGGELEALLLESQRIKEKQPLYNRRLRRTRHLVSLKAVYNSAGYIEIQSETTSEVKPHEFATVLALYEKRSSAKTSLLNIVKTFDLCPKLSGLEKATKSCFSYQLGKCHGACIGKEQPEKYNARLNEAFLHKRIKTWPYDGAVVVTEPQKPITHTARGFIVDQWCIVGQIEQDDMCEPYVTKFNGLFDYDAYKVLKSFMTSLPKRVQVTAYVNGLYG